MVTDNPVRADGLATLIGLPRSHGVFTGESAHSSKADRTLQGLAGLTFAALTLGSLAAPAQAFNLGPAQGYNLFVLGDMNAQNSDVEGRLAVGGNLTVSNFDIGIKAPTNSPDPNLVVGGSITFDKGTIRGGTVSGQPFQPNQNVNVDTAKIVKQDSSSFFSQASQTLNAISSRLMGLGGTSVSTQNNGLTLKGMDTALNVFNLSNINWSDIKYLNIDAPSTSQVLVNISATNTPDINGNSIKAVQWQNMGFNLNGELTASNVLYNLYDATLFKANGVGILGSILAPKASFDNYNGQLNGQGIFNQVLAAPANQASIQENYAPNNPNDPTLVPSPSLLGGLVSLGLAAWRKRRQSAAA